MTPTADATPAPTYFTANVTPEVCVVKNDGSAPDCNASELDANASNSGAVDQRVVVRLSLPSAVIPADAQIVSAALQLAPTTPSTTTWLHFNWGNTYDATDDPKGTFASDPYFWTGRTGNAAPPRDGSPDGYGQWSISEVLDRARASSGTPFDIYLDGDAAKFYGPAASNPTLRPNLQVRFQRGVGFRPNWQVDAVNSTATHQFFVNEGNGNLIVRADDADLGAGGTITRWANSLGGTAWTSGFDAFLNVGLDGSSSITYPTGETTSIDTTSVWGNANYDNDSVDQAEADHMTGAGSLDDPGTHFAGLQFAGVQASATDGGGIVRTYRFPGVDIRGNLNPGHALQLQQSIPSGDDSATNTNAGITMTDTQVQISTGDPAKDATASLRSIDEHITRWDNASTQGTSTPLVKYAYDVLGNVTKVVTPAGNPNVQYTYTAGITPIPTSELLTSVRDSDGSTIDLSYDSLGRVTEVRRELPASASEGEWERWAYSDAPDSGCSADVGTERSVTETQSSGDSILWCVAGTGTIVGEHDTYAPLELSRVKCPAVNPGCNTVPANLGSGDPGSTDPSTADDANDDGTVPAARSLLAQKSPTAKNCENAPTTSTGATYARLLGLDDNSATLKDTHAFKCLQPTLLRQIVPWNIDDSDQWNGDSTMAGRRKTLTDWINAAPPAATLMVSFDNCPTGPSEACDTPPNPDQYRAAVAKFVNDPAMQRVTLLTAFNEPNHRKKGHLVPVPYLSGDNPSDNANLATDANSMAYLAGHYWSILNGLCNPQAPATQPGDTPAPTPPKRCTVLGGDVSDVEAKGSKPVKYTNWFNQYLRGMVSETGSLPTVQWAMHYYTALRQRASQSTGCQAADVTNIDAASQPCWRILDRVMTAIGKVASPGSTTVPWFLTEGGVLYHGNGGTESKWPSDLQTYNGPLAKQTGERKKLRQQISYLAEKHLFAELAKPSVEKKLHASIKSIVQYELATPGSGFDSALTGATHRGDQNALIDQARPAFVALCELQHGAGFNGCWARPKGDPVGPSDQ